MSLFPTLLFHQNQRSIVCHTFLWRYLGNKKKKESAFPLEPCESLYVCASEHGRVVVGMCLDVCDSEHGV